MSTDTGTETLGAAGGEGEGEEPRVPWLADADEQTAEYLASRGWDKDPKGLLASQREAEAALRREQQARASMEAELAEARELAEAWQAQQGQAGQPQGDDPFGLAAAAAAYENGQIDMAQLTQYQTAAVLEAARQMIEGAVSERVDPIANRQTADTLERAAAEIAGTYPDFADLSEDVLELMQQHPAKYGDPEGMWAAYGLVKSRRQIAEAQQAAAARGTETLDTGSRARAELDAAEAIRKQLRDIGAPRPGL